MFRSETPLSIVGSSLYIASRNSCGQFPRIIKMIEDREVDTTLWVTDRMALSEVPARFGELPNKTTVIKVMVDVQEGDA